MNPTGDLAAAYGGSGWSPRRASLEEELGTLWGDWGVTNEWDPLEAVLLHHPGPEIDQLAQADEALMLEELEPARLRAEHQALIETYRQIGVEVVLVAPAHTPPPNTMFCRDLFFMTPQGAVLARPASTVRAGEERLVAQRLAALGVPILLSVHGQGVFEGADALWLSRDTVLLSEGLRTNGPGADQVEALLGGLGVRTVRVDLPYGTMHLLGMVNLAGPDLAVAWPGRLAYRAVQELRAQGYRVLFLPDQQEALQQMALNFVCLRPYHILMPADCPRTQAFYEAHGITCHTLDIPHLRRAAGGMGCLTGIMRRRPS
ncbi:MAG: amidinotransferase [Chloroflexia bacterium]|nr:amidinotransferase [Chloroflexia bacterium]